MLDGGHSGESGHGHGLLEWVDPREGGWLLGEGPVGREFVIVQRSPLLGLSDARQRAWAPSGRADRRDDGMRGRALATRFRSDRRATADRHVLGYCVERVGRLQGCEPVGGFAVDVLEGGVVEGVVVEEADLGAQLPVGDGEHEVLG